MSLRSKLSRFKVSSRFDRVSLWQNVFIFSSLNLTLIWNRTNYYPSRVFSILIRIIVFSLSNRGSYSFVREEVLVWKRNLVHPIGFAYEESSVKSCIWFVISNPISATFNCCSLSPLSLCSHIFSSTLVFAYPSSLNSLSANVTKLERDFAPFSKMQTWWGQDGST